MESSGCVRDARNFGDTIRILKSVNSVMSPKFRFGHVPAIPIRSRPRNSDSVTSPQSFFNHVLKIRLGQNLCCRWFKKCDYNVEYPWDGRMPPVRGKAIE
jgi:hypothetical protein